MAFIGLLVVLHHFIIVNNRFADILNTDKPDERQIMTYVSCYYHAFQGAMQVGERIVWVPTLLIRLIVFESLKLQLISVLWSPDIWSYRIFGQIFRSKLGLNLVIMWII